MHSQGLPEPHGGQIVNRNLAESKKGETLNQIKEFPQISVNNERIWEIENIANGVFSPLEGFLTHDDYHNVISESRLTIGLPWTVPIILDVKKDTIKSLRENDQVILSGANGKFRASMQIEEIYGFDKDELALKVFKTNDTDHPGVAKVHRMKDALLGGKIELIRDLPSPFPECDLSPTETRKLFKEAGWKTIVGFQTRNVPHLGHEYLQKSCLNFFDGLFINPVIGEKKVGDFKDQVILEAYKALVDNYYPKNKVVLAILKTEMRYAGPKEAIFHAIIRKNFGCSHFIVGRDHAGVGNYYAPYAAQEIFSDFPDLGIVPLFFPSVFYCTRCGSVTNEEACPHDATCRVQFSGTKVREIFCSEGKLPGELMRPEVAEVVKRWKRPFVEPRENPY